MTGSAPRRMTMGGGDWVRLLALSVLWGGSFFFNAVAIAELPTLTVVVARVGLAALLLWVVIWLNGIQIAHSRRLGRAFFAMGLLNNVVPFSLIVWGQGHLASGVASILNATTPLFTVLAAHALTHDEKLNVRKLAGAGLAVIDGRLVGGLRR